MDPELARFLEAHSRYQGYRDAAFHLTWEQMSPRLPECDLRVMPFDTEALSFWHAIRHFNAVHPSGGFDWEDIYLQFCPLPRRFDIAIWDGDVLCGLAAGKASRGNENVTIKWIERFETARNNLKGYVAETVFTAAEHYAKILDRQYVMIRNPLPGTEALYPAYGFSLAPSRLGVTYYMRAVA